MASFEERVTIMSQMMSRGGYVRIGLALILVLGALGGGIAFFWNGKSHSASAGPHEGEGGGEPGHVAIQVKSVKPHYDKTFSMIEKRPADVLAYYRDELACRVPGVISMIRTDKGDTVKEGETLITVDVPELEADVKERRADLVRANAQVKQMKAAVVSANAELKVVEAKIKAAEAKWHSDQAYLKFRDKQATRFQNLLASGSIEARLVDEQMDRREAAFEAVNAAEQALEAAKSQKIASKAKIVQAEADQEEAESKVDVINAQLNRALALHQFATIIAPFDGVIVDRDRHANKGAIVQKADNGAIKPLLTIQRSDIVTVVMRVPDNFAPYITPETEAIFETHSLPGVQIHGKVTRFPPSLDNPEHDRTMVVEVDLWNGPKADFDKKKDDKKFRAGLKKGMPGDPNNGLPIVPEIKGELAGGRQLRLLPGMFGQMTLLLRKFDNAFMLPSALIVSQGGNTYIYLVQDGKAHLQQVKVQVDDGKLVKVELLGKSGEVLGDLTGKEEVIISNQGELSEGQLVQPTVVEDWRKLATAKKS